MEVVVMSNKKITIIVHCLLQFIYSLNYVIGINSAFFKSKDE